jgi:hypothetical protein
LGGYGGAGLGAGLTAAGGTTAANVAADTAAKTAAEEAAKNAALEEAAKQQVAEQSAKTFAQEQTKNQLIGAATPDMTMSGIAPPNLAAQYGATNAGITPMPATVQPMPASSAAAPKLTASESLSRAGEGIGQLATKEGRTAFGGKFGMGTAMAGTAPLMMPEAYKPVEEDELKEDNERYVYDYDPGRTYAERGGGTSAERQYFADRRFKNRRTERVAQGGLLSLAEGGETAAPAEGMSGASKAAFDYLMGRSSSSTGQGMQNAVMQAPASEVQPADSNQEFIFNPATGLFTRNPNYAVPAASSRSEEARYNFLDGIKSPFTEEIPRGTPDGLGEYPGGSGFDSSRWSGSSAAQGGLIGLAKGGMASGGFVVPADVVSALGNGSTDAGLRLLNSMLGKAAPIKGKGDGLSDSIPTNIDGKQPARVADGEAYIDPKTVKRMGGAKKLYAMMDKVRAQAHGKTTQQRKVNPGKVMA